MTDAGFTESAGSFQIEAKTEGGELRFHLRDKDGSQALISGGVLCQPDKKEEVIGLVKDYLKKFADVLGKD